MTDYPPTTREPVTRPIMLQRWDSLTYVHWPYDPADVQRILPVGLEVDTFDGKAWVGLVPFHMQHIRPPGVPKVIPWVGTFPETNIRTYVRGPDGRNGVWFSSLDITRFAAVAVARLWYRIPYNWARMSISAVGRYRHYVGVRRWPGPRGAGGELAIEVGEQVPPADVSPFEHFLSARWGLYSVLRRGLAYAPVEHPPWPLHRARLLHLRQDLAEAAGLPSPTGEPHVLYSPGVDVRIGLPQRIT